MSRRSSFHPLMDPDSTITGQHWRIGIITDSLLRLEWSDSGNFEDEMTQIVVNRNWDAKPHYTSTVEGDRLIVDTAKMHLVYDKKPFSKEGLSVTVKNVPITHNNTWHYQDIQEGNLLGTRRTLDGVNGEAPLDPGVASFDGWAILDDSRSNEVIPSTHSSQSTTNPFGTIRPRANSNVDLYIFGYGHRYKEAVQDFYRLCGPTPLIPRFTLGNWWSRYYPYSADEYLRLMDRFNAEGIPLAVGVLDMDWHLTDIDTKYGSGWTGYTWNQELFPDHADFLKELHKRNIRTTLNVHPRDGIRPFEQGYAKAAKSMGLDPKNEKTIDFDLTNPDFVHAYLDLHHDLEDEGVDFWWLDWQQGGVTRQKGLDPLWILNYLHYLDSSRRGTRALTFSRYAGPGSHRYPIGFSGDTVISWKSLNFQPYFTATASNIGYGWWSHDIGGHMFGYRDEELEARWYQLGVFSPINRLHSTDSSFNSKEPWNYHPEIMQSMVRALRLRHRLIPYLYTMNWRAAIEGLPIVEPMYWDNPETSAAYKVRNQYMFGSELMVSPITEPQSHDVQKAHTDVWFPQGIWFDFFDGSRYEAKSAQGRYMQVWRGLDRIPVFAKAGAIIPMQKLQTGSGNINDTDNPVDLDILVFPGASNHFTILEDSGCESPQASDAASTSITTLWSNEDGKLTELRIAGAKGNLAALPTERNWTIRFRGVTKGTCRVIVDGNDRAATIDYDEATETLSISVKKIPASSTIRILPSKDRPIIIASKSVVSESFAVLRDAQIAYTTLEEAYSIIKAEKGGSIASLMSVGEVDKASGRDQETGASPVIPQAVLSALTEVLTRAQQS